MLYFKNIIALVVCFALFWVIISLFCFFLAVDAIFAIKI